MRNVSFEQLSRLVVAVFATALCSCAVPDPMWSANAGSIQDVNYPSTKIVGTWATMVMSEVTTNTAAPEVKVYYEIRPGGRGHLRQVSTNRATGAGMTLEADFTWKYLGSNKWLITLPPSTEYKITSSNNSQIGYRDSVTMNARYWNGNLYVMPGQQVWVPADAEHVAAMAQRMRGQPQLLHLDLQQ
jgi:hypothetical protein